MKNILMTALLALAAVSCVKEGRDVQPVSDVELIIMPQVSGEVTGEIRSRLPITGNKFSVSSQVGLKVKSTHETLNPMYNHFYTAYNGTDWRYYLSGNNSVTTLAGFSSWVEVEVMGYYPYNPEEVTDFSRIPFRIANSNGTATQAQATADYMVAGTKTKNMFGTPLVTLEFEHLMTYLYLSLYRSYIGPALTLSKVTMEIDNGREFIVSGTYDATVPAPLSDVLSLITTDEAVDELEITINKSIPTTVTTTAIPLVIMPQLAVADGGDATIKLTLYFTDTNGNPFLFDDRGNPQISFMLSGIDSGAGLLRGRSYEIKATLGTYVHFDGVPLVKDEPMTDADKPEFIEI